MSDHVAPEDDAEVHEFSRQWWDRLPRAFRVADREQYPPVPLLRYLDGPGSIAGEVYDLNATMWEGGLFDPDQVPERLLPWVAFLLGFSEQKRQMRPDRLREMIRAYVAGSAPVVGTRRYIVEAARQYLEPGARVQVLASATNPWTLILGVAEEEVPEGDYDRLQERLRETDILPAGHALRVQPLRTTWDAWEETAGETWEDKQANIPSWNESDHAGAVVE